LSIEWHGESQFCSTHYHAPQYGDKWQALWKMQQDMDALYEKAKEAQAPEVLDG
jgi:hypothetical protein